MEHQEEPLTSEFTELNEAVEMAASPLVFVDDALIGRTIDRARLAPHRRARVLLHPGKEDGLHEMLIALPRESCDVPHINFKSGKSFHVVQGEMALMLFTARGREVSPCKMGVTSPNSRRMVRLNRPFWHTIIPLSDYVVFLETIIGPFAGNRFADWAPTIGTAEWERFVCSLRGIALSGSPAKP